MRVVMFKGYAHLASALVNGDLSGLSDNDHKDLRKMERALKGGRVVDVAGEEFFDMPDCGGLPGSVMYYEVLYDNGGPNYDDEGGF